MPRIPYDSYPGSVLFNDAAGLSFQGQFPDEAEPDEVWNETEIRDYIKHSRPDLFQNLNQLPIASGHVAEPVQLGYLHLTPSESALMLQSAVAARNSNPLDETDRFNRTEKRQMQMYEIRTMELQHKRNLEVHVLGGQPLILRKLQKPGHLLMCSAPSCRHAIGQGAYFISLLGDRDIHYGLECLENLFADKKRAIRRGKAMVKYHAIDGTVEDESVMPHNLPSNSVENRLLRQTKQDETRMILDEHVHYQQQHPESDRSNVSEDGTLRLQRPPGLEPLEERYKKQGLTRYDRDGARKSRQNNIEKCMLSENDSNPADDGLPLICYCREPESGLDLIKCKNEYCLIGWFHIECCNNDDTVLLDEEFYCVFCAQLTRHAPEIGSDSVDCEAESNIGNCTILNEDFGPEHSTDYDPEPFFNSNNFEKSDAPIDEFPKTPSLPRAIIHSHLVPPYTGSTTGFTTINARPRTSLRSRYHIGLDGVFDLKWRAKTILQCVASEAEESLMTRTTFADLAPFIGYKTTPPSLTGLQCTEILRFESWRYYMPSSKLLAKFCLNSDGINGDLPYGSRLDVRMLAKQWIDRTIQKGHKHMLKDLSEWLTHRHSITSWSNK